MGVTALVANTPREVAGSAAFRAFDFQIHYSMSKVLTLHSTGVDFTAFFDHFDDLVLVINSISGQDISFYQVKSKIEGSWTIKQLSNRPKTGNLPKSIIGKAYYNINQFGLAIRRAAIISNQPLSAKYADGTKVKANDGEIILGKLCNEDCENVEKALTADFPCGVDNAHTKLLTYERTPLDPQSFRITLLGQVTDFIEKLNPGESVVAKPVYDALLSEISRCTGDLSRPATLEELNARKSLARKDIDSLVERVQQRTRNVLEWWDVVAAELSNTEFGAIKQQKLKLGCLSYWRERQRGSLEATALSAAINRHLDDNNDLIGESIVASIAILSSMGAPTVPEGVVYNIEAAMTVEIMERLS